MTEFPKPPGGEKSGPEREPRYTPAAQHFSDDMEYKLEHRLEQMENMYGSQGVELLQRRLLTREDRRQFAGEFLDMLAGALETGDQERVLAALNAIGAATTSLIPLASGEKSGRCPGASYTGSYYVLFLGSGTSGQRVFVRAQNNGAQYLDFTSGEPKESEKLQTGFEILFQGRVGVISSDGKEKQLIVPITHIDEFACPCGSKKKFKECHGA